MAKWERVATQRSAGRARETTTFEFHADGSYRYRFRSDFLITETGAWSVSMRSPDAGVVFLASGVDGPARAAKFQVLSFIVGNGQLTLGEATYERTPLSDQNSRPEMREADRQAASEAERQRVFLLWSTATAHDWQSSSPPPRGEPDTYSLRPDGTYTATFAGTQCGYSGTWSLFSSARDSGQIRLGVPDNACDPRGPRERFVREMPVTVQGAELRLNKTVYRPAAETGREADE